MSVSVSVIDWRFNTALNIFSCKTVTGKIVENEGIVLQLGYVGVNVNLCV